MQVAITTVDNPFDPLTDFDNWYNYDNRMGYNTCEYLARVVKTSENLPPKVYMQAVEDGIDDIIKNNPLTIEIDGKETNLYKKIKRES